jgi:citrate synthase
MTTPSWLSAAEAARRLGVKRETLYAYVSRGLVRSTPKGGRTRARLYAREDIERARRRAEDRRDPAAIATHALSHGSPVLESSITLIEAGRLFYRGQDVVELSRSRSVGEVASLVWRGTFDALPSSSTRRRGDMPAARTLPFVARAQCLLAAAAARDPLAFDLRADAVIATGARILDLMVSAANGVRDTNAPIEERLATGWTVPRRARGLLRSAIILSADHELNVSAFTARCVASAGGTPYGAVIAGLAALEGIKHGGLTTRVESMLGAMRRERSGHDALAARLREGAALDGFGHPLYPDGDPRATELLARLEERYPRSAELRFARDVAAAALSTLEQRPTIDFALATLTRVAGLPPRSGLALFAIGRTIGWIGHALEQYASGTLIRPRAKYIGQRVEGRG